MSYPFCTNMFKLINISVDRWRPITKWFFWLCWSHLLNLRYRILQKQLALLHTLTYTECRLRRKLDNRDDLNFLIVIIPFICIYTELKIQDTTETPSYLDLHHLYVVRFQHHLHMEYISLSWYIILSVLSVTSSNCHFGIFKLFLFCNEFGCICLSLLHRLWSHSRRHSWITS